MRIIFTLLLLLQSAPLFAAKTYSINYTFEDYKTKEVISGLTVQLWNDSDELISTRVTDKDGVVIFSEVSFKYGKLKIVQSEEYYEEPYIGVYNKHRTDVKKTIGLFISTKVQEKLFLVEMEKRNMAYKDAGPIVGTANDSEFSCEDEDFVESQFPGGAEGLQQFISNNVHYPQEAIEMNEQGRVYLGIIIEADGTVTNIVILKKVESASLNFEAKRLIFNTPNWIPATCDGEKVRSRAIFPINFTLN